MLSIYILYGFKKLYDLDKIMYDLIALSDKYYRAL